MNNEHIGCVLLFSNRLREHERKYRDTLHSKYEIPIQQTTIDIE